MSISKLAEALDEYACLEGSELGEYLKALVALTMHQNFIDDDFGAAVKTEMESQLAWLKENCEIRETKETTTRTVRELVFLD